MCFFAGSKTITGIENDEDTDLTTNEDLLEQDESMMTTEDEITAEDQKPVVSFHIRIVSTMGTKTFLKSNFISILFHEIFAPLWYT